MTTAASWEAAADALPPEVSRLLDTSGDPLLLGQKLLAAFPEWQVALPGGSTSSNTDVLAICRNTLGLCILSVEAKVFEDFGPLLAEKRAKATPGQKERLNYLQDLLGVEHFEDSIRYQLLHRTASALLTARDFHAASAVMMVQAFDTPASQRQDFEAFRVALRAQEVASLIYKVPGLQGPTLYLAWCDGNAKFRKTLLPNAH